MRTLILKSNNPLLQASKPKRHFSRLGRTRTGRNRRRRGGQALIELALTISIMLGLSLLIIQYGIILNTTISLSNLAREGARFAAVKPGDDSDIYDQIQAACTGTMVKYSSITSINISPTLASGNRVTGNAVTVTLTYNLATKRFLPATFMGVKIFSASHTTAATMRIE